MARRSYYSVPRLASRLGITPAGIWYWIKRGYVDPPPGVRHINVSHDDWCALFKGGVCNCDPDIREMPPEKSSEA